MVRRLQRSARAEIDIERLFRYSLTKFGSRQAEAYLQRLLQTLDRLKDFPDTGTQIEGHPSRRRLVHDVHVIYYRLNGDAIEILRILDARRDVKRLL